MLGDALVCFKAQGAIGLENPEVCSLVLQDAQ
jgi:hypothetical protein